MGVRSTCASERSLRASLHTSDRSREASARLCARVSDIVAGLSEKDWVRARYRHSRQKPEPVQPGNIATAITSGKRWIAR